MNLSKPLILCLFIVLTSVLSLPLGHAEVIHQPPPVEKVKPIDKKKAKKKKRKLRKKLKKGKPESTNEAATTFLLMFILLIALIVGAFIFGFGIYIAPLMIAGIVIMGTAILTALLYIFITPIASGDAVEDLFSGIGYIFIFIGVVALSFIIGLSFLIWGLVIANPIAWIIGIVLLLVAIILFLWALLWL